jgi:hypothetical protein
MPQREKKLCLMKRSRSSDCDAKGGALENLVGMGASKFFKTVWEQSPLVARKQELGQGLEELSRGLPTYDNLLGIIDCACKVDLSTEGPCTVLMLKDQVPTTEYPSPAAAYLDGCSIIVNHADRAAAGITKLCQSLRANFPHAYAQLYITPIRGKAVQAHADDRDVFVIQLGGSKAWKVYGPPPIPFPMTDEQVGKSEQHPVPKESTAPERLLVETTLNTGDVMYIPRGFVHEASTSETAPSLHLTVALATHDWSWASLAQRALQSSTKDNQKAIEFYLKAIQDKRSSAQKGVECDGAQEREQWFWRRSIPPALVCPEADPDDQAAAKQMAVSVETELGFSPAGSVIASLLTKVSAVHNERQDDALCASAAHMLGSTVPALSTTSWVRRRRDGENAAARREGYEGVQGLIAREEIADTLLNGLGQITTEPFAVSSLGDCPLLCSFGRACFAQVCTDMALVVECADPDGKELAGKAKQARTA